MITGPASIDDARSRGITHWSAFPDVRDDAYARSIEWYFRSGFRRSAEIVRKVPGMTLERCEHLIAALESARLGLRRLGPFRATSITLNHWLDRFLVAAYLRGLSHGLQHARPLLGMQYEATVWADAVDDWAGGDPDIIEFPPQPASGMESEFAMVGSEGAEW